MARLVIEDEPNTDLSGLGYLDLAVTARGVADIMAEHPAFPRDKWPQDVPTPEAIKADCNELVAAGDASKKKEVEEIGKRVLQSITFLAQHAVMRAAFLGDPTIVRTVGLPLKAKKHPRHRAKGVQGVLTVKHGKESGSLVATTGNVPGVDGYELQYSQVDPPTEESYVTAGHYKSGARMIVTGLQPAKKTSLRARTFKGEQNGPWFPEVTIIVL